MVLSHVEPLTEQQIVAVYGLQQSAVQTEEALSQGLDTLYQALSDTVVSDALTCCSTPNVSNYMGQMGLAVHKLTTLEGFVRQVTFHHSSLLCISCRSSVSVRAATHPSIEPNICRVG